ncbi:MAG TPA: rhodanese-like domain-containing protein [Hyphomicrobiaceae bacterium]|nr:rhodanese-like domain-containing protein [Hyphomicrobiaceae bacterium]
MLGWLKRDPIKTLTPQEAYQRHQRGEIALVDVREIGEWRQMRIPGAIHLPLSELPSRLSELPRDKPVVFYCLSGARSGSALRICAQGKADAEAHVGGGITAWRLAGLPVEG